MRSKASWASVFKVSFFAVHHKKHDGLSAVKVHERERDYARERDVYLRLHGNGVGKLRGCNVP